MVIFRTLQLCNQAKVVAVVGVVALPRIQNFAWWCWSCNHSPAGGAVLISGLWFGSLKCDFKGAELLKCCSKGIKIN